jgi:3-hexulose-6-phosphate synthase/6-phospho-3-hexuloisomerase
MTLDIPQPILQIALDYIKLSSAKEIAQIATEELEGYPWLCEAGTPLIKAKGLLKVIPALKKVVGKETKIVADTKIVPEPGEYGIDYEVELATKMEVDIVAITFFENYLFYSELEKAARVAEKYGIGLMIEYQEHLPYNPRSLRRIDKIAGDVSYLEYHIPIDSQLGIREFSKVQKISRLGLRMAIGAAGGLDEETIPTVREYGAGIIVVGGRITRPKMGTPRDAIRAIRDVIYK